MLARTHSQAEEQVGDLTLWSSVCRCRSVLWFVFFGVFFWWLLSLGSIQSLDWIEISMKFISAFETRNGSRCHTCDL